ncbi:17443_t:CDS:2, partial [Dentiscutata erythropus]
MSVNHSMHAESWTKLTLTELKDLCVACDLSVESNKEELGERLHAYFDKRKDKEPEVQLKESNRGQEPGPRNAYDRIGEVVDVNLDEDRGGKEKVKSVLVDVFLTALSSIKRKMDRNFSALYKEIEDGNVLDEAWLKVKLSRPRNQHKYDFLAKIGKYLDKAIRVLPESNRKEIVGVYKEVESRAITLRLANNRGWGTALQIVGSNDKMIEKYKDHIPLFSQAEQSSCSYEWDYRKKAR